MRTTVLTIAKRSGMRIKSNHVARLFTNLLLNFLYRYAHVMMAISSVTIKRIVKTLMNASVAIRHVHNCVKIRLAHFDALVTVVLH